MKEYPLPLMVLVVMILLMGCDTSANSGCKKDTDCRDGRICVDSKCIWPSEDGDVDSMEGLDEESEPADGDVDPGGEEPADGDFDMIDVEEEPEPEQEELVDGDVDDSGEGESEPEQDEMVDGDLDMIDVEEEFAVEEESEPEQEEPVDGDVDDPGEEEMEPEWPTCEIGGTIVPFSCEELQGTCEEGQVCKGYDGTQTCQVKTVGEGWVSVSDDPCIGSRPRECAKEALSPVPSCCYGPTGFWYPEGYQPLYSNGTPMGNVCPAPPTE